VLTLDSIGNIVYNDSAPGERQFRDLDDRSANTPSGKEFPSSVRGTV